MAVGIALRTDSCSRHLAHESERLSYPLIFIFCLCVPATVFASLATRRADLFAFVCTAQSDYDVLLWIFAARRSAFVFAFIWRRICLSVTLMYCAQTTKSITRVFQRTT